MEVRSIEAIVRALNEANVKYLIVGGLAEKWTPKFGPVFKLDFSGSARGARKQSDEQNQT